MGERDLCGDEPRSDLFVTVTYSHQWQAWQAGYTLKTTTFEGESTVMGHATVGFGPYDSSTEVGYWLAGLTKVLKGMTAELILPTS